MATHSRILAWRIPWTEEPGGLQSMGSQRVRNNLATEQQQQKEMSYYAMKRHAGNKRGIQGKWEERA